MRIDLGEQEKSLTLKDAKAGDVISIDGNYYFVLYTDSVPSMKAINSVWLARIVTGEVSPFNLLTKICKYPEAKLTLGPKESVVFVKLLDRPQPEKLFDVVF